MKRNDKITYHNHILIKYESEQWSSTAITSQKLTRHYMLPKGSTQTYLQSILAKNKQLTHEPLMDTLLASSSHLCFLPSSVEINNP